jgi:hypothetical protein
MKEYLDYDGDAGEESPRKTNRAVADVSSQERAKKNGKSLLNKATTAVFKDPKKSHAPAITTSQRKLSVEKA